MNLTGNTKSQIFLLLIVKVARIQCKLSSVGDVHKFLFYTIHSRASANGLLKTMHIGVDSYRKTRADGHVIVSKPHITFLAASNGVSRIDLHFSASVVNNNFSYRTLLWKLFDKN
jgi:hypothetical protein